MTSTASSVISPKSATKLPLSSYRYFSSNVSLRPSPRRMFIKGSLSSRMLCSRVKAQLNEISFFQWSSFESLFSSVCSFLDMLLGSNFGFKVAVDGSSNAMAAGNAKSEVAAVGTKNAMATEESICEFITQVASLVKLISQEP